MSYDLYLLPAGSDDDPDAAYERLEAASGPPDPVKEKHKQFLAEVLRAQYPVLTLTDRDYAEIARDEGISEQEARWQNREVELVGPSIGAQTVEIDLFDDDARVRVESPQRPGDEQMLRLAWQFLRTLVDERAYVPYDAQLERALDLEHDFDNVLASFRALVDEQIGLARAVALEFVDLWESYWPLRALAWEGVVEQHPRPGERGRSAVRLLLMAMNASELDDPTMAQALGLFLALADDFLLIDWSTFSETEFGVLPWQLANRDAIEQMLYRMGIADWCSRYARPLLNREGNELGFGIGPLPGLLSPRDLMSLTLAFSAPGADRAAPDAQRDLAAAIAAALPVCRRVLEHIEGESEVPSELREAAETHGRALIRVTRIAGQPLLRAVALRPNPDEDLREPNDRIALAIIAANCLVVVATSRSTADLDEILMFDSDDLASLE